MGATACYYNDSVLTQNCLNVVVFPQSRHRKGLEDVGSAQQSHLNLRTVLNVFRKPAGNVVVVAFFSYMGIEGVLVVLQHQPCACPALLLCFPVAQSNPGGGLQSQFCHCQPMMSRRQICLFVLIVHRRDYTSNYRALLVQVQLVASQFYNQNSKSNTRVFPLFLTYQTSASALA